MPISKNTLELLKSHELISGLSEENMLRLTREVREIRVKKGKTLFVQEDSAILAYFVVSGWVKLFRHTINGEEYIVDILPHRHIFGEAAMFHENSYNYGAEVVENALLLTIPLTILQALIDSAPGFARNMLIFQARQQMKLEKNREHVVIQNVPQRIGCFLLQLVPDKQATSLTLHLPYDKTLLATRLGMQRETLYRGLAALQKEEVVSMHGASVFIPDIQKLSQFSCAACTHSFPCNE